MTPRERAEQVVVELMRTLDAFPISVIERAIAEAVAERTKACARVAQSYSHLGGGAPLIASILNEWCTK